jgi:hypothetical protein
LVHRIQTERQTPSGVEWVRHGKGLVRLLPRAADDLGLGQRDAQVGLDPVADHAAVGRAAVQANMVDLDAVVFEHQNDVLH